MPLMIAMREVESRNIHSCIKHFDKHVDVPARWSQRANNFCLSHLRCIILKNLVKFDFRVLLLAQVIESQFLVVKTLYHSNEYVR